MPPMGARSTGPTRCAPSTASASPRAASFHARAWSFEEQGDDVMVTGSIRVQRPDGSIADAQLRWSYTFEDGLVKAASFAPLGAANSDGRA